MVEPALSFIDAGKKYTEASLQGHLANGEFAGDEFSADESDVNSTRSGPINQRQSVM